MTRATRRFYSLIPARGGSKGIKHKNIQPLRSAPLISYTIKASLDSDFINDTFVSSDSDAILAVARDYGAGCVKRPKALATDSAGTAPVIDHFIETLKLVDDDYVVLLQPTSPLRSASHIDAAITFMLDKQHTACISVQKAEHHHPYKALRVDEEGTLAGLISPEAPFLRRQDCPECCFANGAIYIFKVDAFREAAQIPLTRALPFLMSARESIDVDTENDLKSIEEIMKNERKL